MEGRSNGAFYRFINRLTNLTILGFFWILTSIPVITIGASSTALYYAAVKSVRFEEGQPIKEYFRAFKSNLLHGCLGSLIYLLLGGMLFYICQTPQETGIMILLIVSTVLLFSSALYFFPILSRFNLNAYRCFQVSLYMIMRCFPQTCLMLLVAALCGFVFGLFPFLLPVLAGCFAYYSSLITEKIFREYMDRDSVDADMWFMMREE